MLFFDILLLLACLIFLLLPTNAQETLTSKGCVDPTGFNSCYNTVTQTAERCIKNNCNSGTCSGPDNCSSTQEFCYSACIAVAYQGWLNCAIASCWNRAYSCEFQELQVTAIMQSIQYLDVIFPPYYPAPGGVPGSCSCRTGLVYGEIHQWISDTNQCNARVSNGGYPSSDSNYCYCCGASKALSALYAICPSTNPSKIPFLSKMQYYAEAQSAFYSSECESTYSPTNVNCAAAPYEIEVYGQKFYSAKNLPAPGKIGLKNSAGELGKPLAKTIVWSLASGLVPSTAIAAQPKKSAMPE